jgi:regulatory protein
MSGNRNPTPEASAYVDAMKMLARRELSEAQVRQKLTRHGHMPDDIDRAVERLKEESAIDDRRVAQAIARNETSIKRHGKIRVKQRIARAGIAAATAKSAIDEAFADLDDGALLEAALAKRLRHGRHIADDRERQRLYRFLIGQGFDPSEVLKALSAKRSG